MSKVLFPQGSPVVLTSLDGCPLGESFMSRWLRDVTLQEAGDALVAAVLAEGLLNHDYGYPLVLEAYSYDFSGDVVEFIYVDGVTELWG